MYVELNLKFEAYTISFHRADISSFTYADILAHVYCTVGSVGQDSGPIFQLTFGQYVLKASIGRHSTDSRQIYQLTVG